MKATNSETSRTLCLLVNSRSDISSRICSTFSAFSKSKGSDFMMRPIRTGWVFMLMTREWMGLEKKRKMQWVKHRSFLYRVLWYHSVMSVWVMDFLEVATGLFTISLG